MATLEIDPNYSDRSDYEDNHTKFSNSIGARILRSRSHLERRASDAKAGKFSTKNSKELSEKQIKSLYMNKSSNFRTTPLETIFEQDEQPEENEGENSNSSDSGLSLTVGPAQIFGKRKMKRAVLFSESKTKPTKTLREKRKKRIQALLGNRKRFKHMSMKSFLERFEGTENVAIPVDNNIVNWSKSSSLLLYKIY